MKEGTDRAQLLKNLAHLKRELYRSENGVYCPIDSSDLMARDKDRLRAIRKRDIAQYSSQIYEIEHQLAINKLLQDLEQAAHLFEEAKKILEERMDDFWCKIPCGIWHEAYTEWKKMFVEWREKWDI